MTNIIILILKKTKFILEFIIKNSFFLPKKKNLKIQIFYEIFFINRDKIQIINRNIAINGCY